MAYVHALNNDRTLLNLLLDCTNSGEDALRLKSTLDLSDKRPGQEEA